MEKLELISKIEEGLSTYKIAKQLNKSNSTIIYWIKNYNLIELYKSKTNYSHSNRNILDKYTKLQFEEVIKKCNSIADVIKYFNLVNRGNNYKTINYYIKLYNINIDHFNPIIKNIGMKKEIPLELLLITNSNASISTVKRRLYKLKLKLPICELCGQTELWQNKKMSLILDHINGDHTDNRLENLRIVCPNCNATLPTHCRKNKRKYAHK